LKRQTSTIGDAEGETMTFFSDLGRKTLVADGEHVRAVGWLHPDHPFSRGAVPPEFVVRLKEFMTRPSSRDDDFHFPGFGGIHACEFCGKAHGGGNLGVPSENLLYIFPDMLVHYIEAHDYKPPAEFITALLHSPFRDEDQFQLLSEPFWHLHRQAQERKSLESVSNAG